MNTITQSKKIKQSIFDISQPTRLLSTEFNNAVSKVGAAMFIAVL